ncbi:hypothetical protein E1263_08300 [Kribbella antibiotica]|uniref:Uncharacterized protein n=1 Tax=Kribbella antibiotica TaxID=190195 RepID=A0A4R4ZQE8_9ACTN|nr:hypothetical protein [Kribbella antibiotica]TDD61178.1 hypothetical protein E1263_08300 [Kribbella antibiotica]
MPRDEEVVAIEQVMDLFATEALLALEKADRPAERLAEQWQRLGLDELQLSDSEAQQHLAAAVAGAPMDSSDLRREYRDSYGRSHVPPLADQWLDESLTRLARAGVLRDVVATGTKLKVSEPLRKAADDLVREGMQLLEGRRFLDHQQTAPLPGRKAQILGYATALTACTAYGTAVQSLSQPIPVQAVLLAPALVYLTARYRNLERDWMVGRHNQVTPAKDQLADARWDAADAVDAAAQPTRADTRVIRAARREAGPSR